MSVLKEYNRYYVLCNMTHTLDTPVYIKVVNGLSTIFSILCHDGTAQTEICVLHISHKRAALRLAVLIYLSYRCGAKK